MSENPNQQNTPNAPGGAKLGTLHTDAPAASTTRTNEYSNPSQTRAGTAKMKFAPKIQPRKKPTEVKQVCAVLELVCVSQNCRNPPKERVREGEDEDEDEEKRAEGGAGAEEKCR